MLTLIQTVYAAPNSLKPVDAVSNPTQALGLLGAIASWMFAILLTIAVIFVLLAAFKYLTSKGGEGVSDAHRMLLYAAVAIAVAVLARGIVSISADIAGQREPVKFENPR